MHHLNLTSDPQGDPATAFPYAFPPGTTLPNAGAEYAIDAWQRNVLFADVMRERGNQYQAHLHERTPNVLDFAAELILDGRTLPRPVSYGLVRIISPDDLQPDRNAAEAHDAGRLRPFIVFDPRAGHGPGIGGFKRDSEIGAALRAGHPCYFVGSFLTPYPVRQSKMSCMRKRRSSRKLSNCIRIALESPP